MKKTTLMILAIATSFCFGFAFNTIITKQTKHQMQMKKVTGIGGVFFKCKDTKKMKEWYQIPEQLGHIEQVEHQIQHLTYMYQLHQPLIQ